MIRKLKNILNNKENMQNGFHNYDGNHIISDLMLKNCNSSTKSGNNNQSPVNFIKKSNSMISLFFF
jgi:hypothetical protein